jgi:hypothetical protein
VVYFPLAFPPIIYMRSSSPHPCYMTRPSHPPRLDYCNYTWRRVQIMNGLHSSVFQKKTARIEELLCSPSSMRSVSTRESTTLVL